MVLCLVGYVWQFWFWVARVGFGVMMGVYAFLIHRIFNIGKCSEFYTVFFLIGVSVGWLSVFAVVIVVDIVNTVLELVQPHLATFTSFNFSMPILVVCMLIILVLAYFIIRVFSFLVTIPVFAGCEDYSYSWKPLNRYFTYYVYGVILGSLILSSILLVIW
jgi:hypothetical protein